MIMRHMERAMAILLITELREMRQPIHISLIPPFRPAMNEMQLRTGNELIHGALVPTTTMVQHTVNTLMLE